MSGKQRKPPRKDYTRLIYAGEVFRVEFLVAPGGHCLAKEWLEAQPLKIQNKFGMLFKVMGDQGKIRSEQKFKHLAGSDQIFEFKADSGRVLSFFFIDRRIILTNGFSKKSKKTPKGEIERAEALKQYFLSKALT